MRYRKKTSVNLLKFVLAYLLMIVLTLNILPALLVGGLWSREEDVEVKGEKQREEEVRVPEEKVELKIYDVDKGELINMELEEYITGVVTGEMPASFHPQALKSQAIAARTYALNKALGKASEAYGGGREDEKYWEAGGDGEDGGETVKEGRGCESYPEADLCTDFSCCQEFKDEKSALSKWPAEEKEKNYERIKEAVYSTAGLVLTHEGSLVQSVYHSTCGGMTEEAAAVWSGGGHPYLASVECSYCRHSAHFENVLAVELSTFADSFHDGQGLARVGHDGSSLDLQVVKQSPSGRNQLVRLGGKTYSGTELRQIFDLPSTRFNWTIEGDHLVFNTRGFGHGVGLCQYGADGMATGGKDFEQILKHYYKDVEISQYFHGTKNNAPDI